MGLIAQLQCHQIVAKTLKSQERTFAFQRLRLGADVVSRIFSGSRNVVEIVVVINKLGALPVVRDELWLLARRIAVRHLVVDGKSFFFED